MEKHPGAAYYAPHNWMKHVQDEVGRTGRKYGALYVTESDFIHSVWAQSIWTPLYDCRFSNAQDAIRQLQALGKNWMPYEWTLKELSKEISRKIPTVLPKTQKFPYNLPDEPIGTWMLLDDHRLLACPQPISPFGLGNLMLQENNKDPPSSAYLKLQEALVRLRYTPNASSFCIDAGACPGGWSWVLLACGAHVHAIDRSPLDPRIMSHPKLSFTKANAFTILPAHHEPVDLVCSDVICYPAVLYRWVMDWVQSGKTKRMIVTIKMQGNPDWQTIRQFQAIPDSCVYHGSYNKHELTWIWPSSKP